MKIKFRKSIALICLSSVMFMSLSPLFAKKAEAQWVVLDPSNLVQNIIQVVKDFGLDAIAWQLANMVIERMSAATVNWINGGFNGSPAFVTDPESYFKDMGDQIAGQYIFSNPNLNFLCGPISAKIRIALTNNYLQDKNRWQCTLTQVGKNMDNFMGNFQNGGWDNFFELTQKTQNNPIGAYTQAENEMYLQIATRQGTKKTELDWGKGFMSFEVCGPEGRDPNNGACIGSATIVTPGSVISDQLNKQLGLGSDKLAAADEINEIVSSLLNQLVSHVVGSAVGGLRGLSSPNSTGGQTFTNQLSNSTAAGSTGYFGDKQDTKIDRKSVV
jgi:hypothetical protein